MAILSSQPDNIAVLSNVGEVTGFTIKATAKSFSILSSGLYANKIRAIIRELSCNAYDSHVAAKNLNTPFDVHLPNNLEPYFSIRDYGIGLSHKDVTNIFTTFFESTKTDSNDYVGALGLGSKSPFSYTDNFTVTAIKAGRKGIYTAFINEHGVPAIALMAEENSSDPAGVEIRFAVEDRYDFNKFYSEAQQVFTHFKHRPIVSGYSQFKFTDMNYKETDIIPGVHVVENRSYYDVSSYAVMGNVAYDIHVPQPQETLGNLSKLLNCGLVLEFGIGELDFQASREGLSYIPQTINAIKHKLEKLNDALTGKLLEKLGSAKTNWEKSYILVEESKHKIWNPVIVEYIKSTNFNLVVETGYGVEGQKFDLSQTDLAKDYNIAISAFNHKHSTFHIIRPQTDYSSYTNGKISDDKFWNIQVSKRTHFVINDTKVGAGPTVKNYFKNNENIYILNPADRTKPMNTIKFFKAMYNPPKTQIKIVSELPKPERLTTLHHVSVLKLENSDVYRNKDMVWRPSTIPANQFPTNKTYYYVPLKGYEVLGKYKDINDFSDALRQSGILTETLYGVRKSDIDEIKTMPNWIDIDDFVQTKLDAMIKTEFLSIVKSKLNFKNFYQHNITTEIDKNSPYMVIYNKFNTVPIVTNVKVNAIYDLTENFGTTIDGVLFADKLEQCIEENNAVQLRYPFLNIVPNYCSITKEDTVDYINAIDMLKGIVTNTNLKLNPKKTKKETT